MQKHKYRMYKEMMRMCGYTKYITYIPHRYIDELPDSFFAGDYTACQVLRGLLFDHVPQLYQTLK